MGAALTDVHITNIGKELDRLWDEAQGQDQIRASLFNLIVHIHGAERVKHFEQLINRVVSKFPSRVIFIISEGRKEENYLATAVSSQTIGEGDLKIFCETIRIEVGGSQKERVPFLVTPHILSDLPVYLLWTQDPATESSILPHLVPYANRIIFDTEAGTNLQAFSRSLHSLAHSFTCEVGDLHWSGISGWRSLLINAFNSADELAALEEAKQINITYNQGDEIEAAYFQAWLASRLEWKFETFEVVEGNVRLSYRRPTHEVVIFLKPKAESNLRPGALLSVEIESTLNGKHYLFARHPRTRQVTIQISDSSKCALPVTGYLSGAQEGKEIIEEIFYPASKRHYQEMLKTLAQIPWRT